VADTWTLILFTELVTADKNCGETNVLTGAWSERLWMGNSRGLGCRQPVIWQTVDILLTAQLQTITYTVVLLTRSKWHPANSIKVTENYMYI